MKLLKTQPKKVLQEQIKKLNIASAIVSAVFAVAIGVLLVTTTVDLALSFMTRDELASTKTVVLAPGAETIVTVQLRYLLAGIFAVTAILSLLLATKLRSRYVSTLKAKISGFRWLLIGVSSALLLEFVSLLAGVNDAMELKLIGGLVLTTSLLGWLSERENAESKTPKYLAYTASIFTGVLAWLPLVGSLFGTSFYGIQNFGWYVYALSAVLLVGFIAFAVNQYFHLSGRKGWKEYLFIERNYLAVDLAIKFVFGAIVLIALHK